MKVLIPPQRGYLTESNALGYTGSFLTDMRKDPVKGEKKKKTVEATVLCCTDFFLA